MFKSFKCFVCNKWKKDQEKAKKIEYYSRHNYRLHSRIHLSCIEEPIKNPENYSIDVVDKCIDLVKHFEFHFQEQEQERIKRQKFEEEVMKDVQTVNLELFLSKAKGNNIMKFSTSNSKEIDIIEGKKEYKDLRNNIESRLGVLIDDD